MTKRGGKREGAGRKPAFGIKGEPTKTIQINVPKRLHCELKDICKLAIKNHMQNEKL